MGLTKQLARVKFEYFREKFGVLQIEVSSKGKWWDPETFWHGERIGSFHGQMEGMSHSVMVRGLVPSMSDMSAEPLWCDCRIGSYMIKNKHSMPFLEWRHLFSYQVAQSGTGGHSDMTIGFVPTWSYVSASPSDMHARLVPCMCKCKCRSLSNMYVGLIPCMCWM